MPSTHNEHTRTTQLDPITAAALDEWQQRHGVRSTSAAIRQLLRLALAMEPSDVEQERLVPAQLATWEATRRAVQAALDRAKPGRAPSVEERVQARAAAVRGAGGAGAGGKR